MRNYLEKLVDRYFYSELPSLMPKNGDAKLVTHLSNYNVVSHKCADIIAQASDRSVGILIAIDNYLPPFFVYGDFVINAIHDLHSKNPTLPIKIIIRENHNGKHVIRNNNVPNSKQYTIDDLKAKLMGGQKPDIQIQPLLSTELERLNNQRLKRDYYIIVDRRHIFIGRPSFNDAVLFYNAPFLCNKIELALENFVRQAKTNK